jgi:hypothetical protein
VINRTEFGGELFVPGLSVVPQGSPLIPLALVGFFAAIDTETLLLRKGSIWYVM